MTGDHQTLALVLFGAFVAVTLGITTYVSRNRHGSAEEFYAGGRLFSPMENGFAIAGDYMSAASFLGISGLIALYGYDGLLYSVGFLVAWLVVLFLVAELVRNCGRFTLADVVAARMRERPVRIAAGTSSVTVSVLYLVAQMVGAGSLVALLLGGTSEAAQTWTVIGVGALMVIYVSMGGMRATTWIQIVKAAMLMLAGCHSGPKGGVFASRKGVPDEFAVGRAALERADARLAAASKPLTPYVRRGGYLGRGRISRDPVRMAAVALRDELTEPRARLGQKLAEICIRRLIFAAMLCDALDGKVARLTRQTSDFGAQLDSLADVVSFGAAPAFLALQVFKVQGPEINTVLSRLVWAIGALYFSCAALRLARFNVSNEHGEQHHYSFLGLPSPGAGGAVVAFILMQQDMLREGFNGLSRFCVWLLPLVVGATGLLMVSNVRYPHVVNRYLRGKRSVGRLLFVLGILLLLVVWHQYTLGIGMLVYAMVGPASWAYARLRPRTLQQPQAPATPAATAPSAAGAP